MSIVVPGSTIFCMISEVSGNGDHVYTISNCGQTTRFYQVQQEAGKAGVTEKNGLRVQDGLEVSAGGW